MEPRTHELANGRVLLIREADGEDTRAVLDYVNAVCGESDFLSFGPGEFERTEPEEEEYLRQCRAAGNRLYLLGMIDGIVVATLSFAGGQRPRLRHSGEFGMSVRKVCWGLGIGSLMLDALIQWAGEGGIVKKINLRVRTDNRRAIRLYESKGFVMEGALRKEILLDGRYYDHYWMGLEL
jgi:RimJ/RimL family protein N-acetyltransferase